MGVEIERKFLLSSQADLPPSDRVLHIRQGYLSKGEDSAASIRVRICNDKGYLTIKGGPKSNASAKHAEYEYPIPLEDAVELLTLCTGFIIVKTRQIIHDGDVTWEVDFFEEENEGLIVAEVELPHEYTPLRLPPWIGKEVTGDPAYYNSALSAHPFVKRKENN